MGTQGQSEGAFLKAARLLVEGEGPEALTMDRLGAILGVSRATVYRRLGSRKAILEALGVGEAGSIERRILDGARQVFTREGFEGATVEAVAEAAGVGPATIYRRFGGREGLIGAFMEEVRPNAALGRLEISADMPLEESLVAFAERAMAHLRANQDIVLLLLAESRRPRSPLAGVPGLNPGKTVSRLAQVFEQAMAAGRLAQDDPKALAIAFVLPLLGEAVFRPRAFGGAIVEGEAYARDHVRRFLRGVLPREGSR